MPALKPATTGQKLLTDCGQNRPLTTIRVKILELPTTLMDISKLDNSMAQMLMETVNNMLIELYAAMAQAEIEKKEKR